MTDAPPPAPVEAPKGTAPAKAKKPLKKPAAPKKPLFGGDAIAVDIVDDVAEKARMRRILRVVQMQIVIILGMTFFLILAAPFLGIGSTIYQYFAVDSSDANRHTTRLVHITEPNLTNQAIISWATNSITEIMTFGFGDYVPHLRAQKDRFTPEGWESFVNAFDKMKLGQTFRDRQLVLTTVPSDTAVIVKQGYSIQHVYEWKIQMPVIMTYATNDNVTHRDRAVIALTLARVPAEENPSGVAIKTWTLGG